MIDTESALIEDAEFKRKCTKKGKKNVMKIAHSTIRACHKKWEPLTEFALYSDKVKNIAFIQKKKKIKNFAHSTIIIYVSVKVCGHTLTITEFALYSNKGSILNLQEYALKAAAFFSPSSPCSVEWFEFYSLCSIINPPSTILAKNIK